MSEHIYALSSPLLVFSDEMTPTFTHPLSRRMTLLQKAVLEGITQFSKLHSDIFEKYSAKANFSWLYATTYGELASVLTLRQQIANHEQTISPTHFQHSVHNSASGYISILFDLKQKIQTVSSGFLSGEKSIFSAYQRIKSGQISGCFIVIADEFVDISKSKSAWAEVILLTSNKELNSQSSFFELIECEYIHNDEISIQNGKNEANKNIEFIDEDQINFIMPHLGLIEKNKSFRRAVRSLNGECIETNWKML